MLNRLTKALIFLGLLFYSVFSNAQISKPEQEGKNWFIRISPHFWFINLKGEIYRPPSPPTPSQLPEPEEKKEIDVSFGELKGSLKFAFMGSGEYVQNRFIAKFNVISFILEGEVITPLDLVLQETYLRFGYLSGDLGFGYGFINKPKMNLFALGGLKFVYFDIGAESNLLGNILLEGERDKWLLDPVIGTYFKYRPYNWLELNTYADVGLIIGSQITAQFIGEINFFLARWFYLSGGYRYWFLEVPKNEAIYNGHIRGSLVKIGFQIN